MRTQSDVAIAVAIALTAVFAGCDKDAPDEPPTDREKSAEAPRKPEREAPEWDWRRALRSSLDELESAFDIEGDCPGSTAAVEEARRTRDGVRFSGEPRFCQLSAPETADRTTYHVDRVLFSDKRAVAVSIVPHGPLPLDSSALEAFELPRLPMRRDRFVEENGERRAAISFRADRLGDHPENAQPVAVDLVAEPDDEDRIARIDIYENPDLPRVLDRLRLEGPPAASRSLVVPPSVARAQPFADIAVQFDLERVELRRWNDYTLRPPEARGGVGPVELATAATTPDTGPSDWWSRLEHFIEALDQRSASTTPSNSTFGIAATQTASMGRIESIVLALEQLLDPKFQLLVRRAESLRAPFSRRAALRAVNVEVRTGPIETTTDRTGAAYLNLSVHATLEGFRLEAGSRTLPPIEGCPDPGPTICLAETGRNLRGLLERAASRQKSGDLEAAASLVERAVRAFDWAALYRNVRNIQRQHQGAGYIHVSTAPGVPVAVLVRIFDVTGYRFRASEADGCEGPFPTNVEFRPARPCENADGELRRLFSQPIWRLR